MYSSIGTHKPHFSFQKNTTVFFGKPILPTRHTKEYGLFGAPMAGRTFNSTASRIGFGGYEKDNEISGSGNAYDFEGYGYDPRIGRRKGLDPLAKKYPDDSPYMYSGDSPISIADNDGKSKTYYITKIAKDGTTTTLKVVEKYTVRQITSYASESIGVGGVTLFTSPQISNTKTFDLAQVIVIDERTGTVKTGAEYVTTERSNSAIIRGIEDNASEATNYLEDQFAGGGGIVFTTKSEIGGNQETRKAGKYTDLESENIDLLMSVIGAASSASSVNGVVKNLVESFKKSLDLIQISKDVDENIITPLGTAQVPAQEKKVVCSFCGDTIPESKKSQHPSEATFTPVKSKEVPKKH